MALASLVSRWRARRMRDPVRGTLVVTSASRIDPATRSQAYRLHGVVHADGLVATSVAHAGVASVERWPRAGGRLPVVVDRADPTRLKVLWDEVPVTSA
jgi:hypothetical protein